MAASLDGAVAALADSATQLAYLQLHGSTAEENVGRSVNLRTYSQESLIFC